MTRKHLVLWDGECGFCRQSVEWLQKHDRFGSLQFQPFQEAPISSELRAACEDSIHVITTDGDLLHGGRAAMFLGRATRWNRLARVGEWPMFLPFVNLGYKIVAHNRPFFSKLVMRAKR